jgi:Uma2 family endonuclease
LPILIACLDRPSYHAVTGADDIGIPHYWIVDPRERSIEERTLEEDDDRLSASAVQPAELRLLAFDDLVIDLSDVFGAGL